MENKKKREKVYFSIQKDILEKFEKHIEEKLFDKSKLIEYLIVEYLKTIQNN